MIENCIGKEYKNRVIGIYRNSRLPTCLCLRGEKYVVVYSPLCVNVLCNFVFMSLYACCTCAGEHVLVCV